MKKGNKNTGGEKEEKMNGQGPASGPFFYVVPSATEESEEVDVMAVKDGDSFPTVRSQGRGTGAWCPLRRREERGKKKQNLPLRSFKNCRTAVGEGGMLEKGKVMREGKEKEEKEEKQKEGKEKRDGFFLESCLGEGTATWRFKRKARRHYDSGRGEKRKKKE